MTDKSIKSPFPYSNDNKRYHTLSYYMQKTFGERVFKASIDGNFSCPNIDGTVSVGGCTFCRNGSGEFAPQKTLSVTEQLTKEAERLYKKWGTVRMIAYFQVHTNTYANVEVLREKYEEAIFFPNVVGLSVGTRPDCINEENVKLLKELSKKTHLTVELGLQTVHDKTAKQFNRGYDFSVFCKAFRMLKENNIRVCVHLINGLYCETRDEMIESARVIGKMRPDSVKIHLLHILKGTKAEEDYNEGIIVPMAKDRYIDVVIRQLEVLPPECVIERLTGDGAKEHLKAPLWSKDKISVLAGIDKELFMRGAMQGEFFAESLDSQ